MGRQNQTTKRVNWLWWAVTAVLLTAVSACRTPNAAPPVTPTSMAALASLTATPAATNTVAATAVPPAYPATEASPTASLPPTAYPVPATAVPPAAYPPPGDQETYLPLIGNGVAASPTPVFTPTPSPIPPPTAVPTIDFAAMKTTLQSQGQDLAFAKIGFHVSVGGNTDGLGDWMRQLDAVGVPFFLKSADNAEPLFVAQELMRQSGVPHTLVYRKVAGGDHISVPYYDLPPQQAAELNWQEHTAAFPPELDPGLVWMETMNEVDKNRSEWLAEFALAVGQMALRDGRKWAAFGWAAGEPEPSDSESPKMLAFLRLAGDHPDQIAIAVHEYSYNREDIGDGFPYKIGRFTEIFRIADKYGIPRPTVLITEWGWTYDLIPEPPEAMIDIDWAARLYAPFPQVKGAAIWYLGPTHNELADATQRLIAPVTEYSLTHYFSMPQPPEQAVPDANLFPPP